VTDEDTTVALNLDLVDLDMDGNESVPRIELRGLPAGSQLTDGVITVDVFNPTDTVDVTGLNLSIEDLKFTPPADFFGDIEVTVNVSDNTGGANSPSETRSMLIRVNPVNDPTVFVPITQTVDENGTAQIDINDFVDTVNDPDQTGISSTLIPTTGYTLNADSPITSSGGTFVWGSTSGTAGTIDLDATHTQFNPNPTTDNANITAAFDFAGTGGGDLSIDEASSLEIWFRPDNSGARQTLIEFGDENGGWGLYLFDTQLQLHFLSADAPDGAAPHILTGGSLSSTEFNQAIVTFDTDGGLAGDSTRPDVALYVNGERVDLLTDLQTVEDAESLIGPFDGSLGVTDGGFVHATETTYDGFIGSIASVTVFDQAINETEARDRFLDATDGNRIIEINGQEVEVGVAQTLASGAIVTLNVDGTITYDPNVTNDPNGQFEQLDEFNPGNPDSFQADAFEITVSNNEGDTQTLQVDMTVQGENDAPMLSVVLADPAPTALSEAGDVVAIATGSDVDTNGQPTLRYAIDNDEARDVFAINEDTGEITILSVQNYRNLPNGGSHEINVSVTNTTNESDPAENTAVATLFIRINNLPTGQITGTVYEDVVGDGSVAGDQGVDDVTVLLYRDDGNGVRDVNDTFVTDATTTGGGNYVFNGPLITLADYYVVVDSRTITPSNGFNTSFGVDDVWAEQTYGSAGALSQDVLDDGSVVETVSAGGALFGGYSGTRSDDVSSLVTAEHVSQVTVSDGLDGSADFGFSFNVVTNTLGGDSQDDDPSSDNRSVQGSLRQFIQNANAIDNSDDTDVDNVLRFVARNDANSLGEDWWTIVISEQLPEINDSHTVIDGTVYAADGSGALNAGTNRFGSELTVGANDSHEFTGFAQPRLEIVADQSLADADKVLYGLTVAATADQPSLSDITISNISIHGFGSSDADGANILITGAGPTGTSDFAVDNVTIENNLIGVAPDGQPLAADYLTSGIEVIGADGGLIQNNLIANHGLSGIFFATSTSHPDANTATDWRIARNEITANGSADLQSSGLQLGNSTRAVVQDNLITNNAGFGIDTFFAPGDFLIEDNTVAGNGTGGLNQGGIRIFGNGSVVSGNRIIDNLGTGISVVGTSEFGVVEASEVGDNFAFAATDNELTQNQFGDNTGIDIDLISSLTNGQTFADLDVNGSRRLGPQEIESTGLSLEQHDTNDQGQINRSEYNDAQLQFLGQGDGDDPVDGFNEHSGNQGLDEPVLVSATRSSDQIVFEFQLAPGVDRVELYEVTNIAEEERVTFVTTLLVANMTVDPATGFRSATLTSPPTFSGQLTAIAFDAANTSEFGNRIVLNSPPSAASNTVLTNEDTPRELSEANFGFDDTEDLGDISLGRVNIGSVTGGTLELSGSDLTLPASLPRSELNNLTFVPTPNSTSDGTINFTVVDSEGATDGTTYTLTVQINSINDAPTTSPVTLNPIAEDSGVRTINQTELLGNVSDVDSDSFLATGLTITNGNGTLIDNGDGTWNYTPDLNDDSEVTFTYTISDGTDNVAGSATLDITPVNDAPTATVRQLGTTLLANEDPASTGINLNSVFNDVDADNSLTFSIIDQGDLGLATVDANGNVVFQTASASSSGQNSFQVVAIDSDQLQSEIVTVDLNVIGEVSIPSRGGNEPSNEPSNEPTNDTTSNDDGDDSGDSDNDNLAPSMPVMPDNTENTTSPDSLPALVSNGVVSVSDNPIDFNDFDDDETTQIDSDNLSTQLGRTYDYSLNIEEIQLINQFSLDPNNQRSASAVQFDVNVLASAFLDDLDSSKQQFIDQRLAIGTPEVAVSAASLLTISYLVWNMASGILVSTFMSSLPAWSSFDILPVISSSITDQDDDESIEQIVDA